MSFNYEVDQQSTKVPLTIQEFNSDDKLEQANKLINILAKRKKLSIIVSMLMVFQEKNFPKMLKDYLIESVKDYIQLNPGRVISYNGEPFTRDNCIRGMSVVIGKHRVIQKEMIDGAEYLRVNLVQASIFLSDEISKICQGPRGNRPIHCSLVDEPKYEFKKGQLGSNLIGEKRKRSNASGEEEDDGGQKMAKAAEANDDYDEVGSNSKLNLDMRDDDEFSIGQEEKILNNNYHRGNIISLGDSDNEGDMNFARPENINNNLSKGDNLDNFEGSVNNNLANDDNNANIESLDKDELNNFGEAPTSMSNSNSNLVNEDTKKTKSRNKNSRKDRNRNSIDTYKSKYPFQEIVNVKNFGKSSQLSIFLRENKDSILKYVDLFKTIQNLGKEGQKYCERLEKLNPQGNQEDSKSQMENNEENNMEEIFKEFEVKKENLIRIYKRIQTTVGSIYALGDNFDSVLVKDDVDYLNINSKIYDDLLEEMFPFFDKINAQTQHFSIAKITKNLQRISDSLKDNDIVFKNFFVFIQSMLNRIPMGAIRGNNLCDILGEEVEDIKERKKQFYDILNKEKDKMINVIEPILAKLKEGENNDNNKEMNKKIENEMEEEVKDKKVISVGLVK